MVFAYVYGGQVEREGEFRLIFKEFKLDTSVIRSIFIGHNDGKMYCKAKIFKIA